MQICEPASKMMQSPEGIDAADGSAVYARWMAGRRGSSDASVPPPVSPCSCSFTASKVAMHRSAFIESTTADKASAVAH